MEVTASVKALGQQCAGMFGETSSAGGESKGASVRR